MKSQVRLCEFLRKGVEPLQTVIEDVYYDDLDESSQEDNDIRSMQC